MQIDRQHRPWALGVLGAAGIATGLYVAANHADPSSPGSTHPGLGLGGAAAALIVFAALLGVRRRFRRLRLGTVAGWLRAHFWLALLSLLLSLYHGGFRLGGFLSSAVTLLLVACVGSGLLGALLQHILPGVISARSSIESAEDPIRTIALLRRQAYQTVWAASGSSPDANPAAAAERDEIHGLLGEPPRAPDRATLRPPGTLLGQQDLAQFYCYVILPFLRESSATRSRLLHAADALLAFDSLAAALAEELHPTLDELSSQCEGVRQARRQIRMQAWIHGWLLLHIPLSMALLVLLAVHAVTALRY